MSKIYKGPAKIRKDSQEKERCVILGEYIIKTNGTVREAAARFGISKSTVHKDVTEKLRETDRTLYGEVKKVLVRNKAERHLRGGQATKQKYCAMKKISG
ncbi:MAG: stage III sporulation protein D [Clostridiales bacterium]|jgi:putative DeoR family transcriptional regulator (stage III sporulation protein D)|nr:stage III sporulation protein D [Clostridiales bacterium]